MKDTAEGFRQEILLKYKIKANETFFLRWFVSFSITNKIKTITEDEETYYWIKYSKVIEDLPFIYDNIFSVRRSIKKLIDSGIIEQKLVKVLGSGTRTYFKINPIILYELENIEMNSLITGKEISSKKGKQKKRIAINKNILRIFQKIKDVELDDKPLFNHEEPIDENNYTSIYYNFQNAMFDLYCGRFLTRYKIDTMEDWFKKKYNYYLDKEKIISKIRSCKNNWKEIEKVMIEATKNYALWFNPDTEVPDKSKLKKDLNIFIYHPQANISMFYVCLLYKPTTYREALAENIYDDIPGKIVNLCNPIFKKENYDGFGFWNKIRSMVKWYDTNMSWLCSKDSNCQYWLQSRSSFFENYLEWIKDKVGDHPKLGNFGVGNKTFDWYVSEKIKEHDITVTVPRGLNKT